MIVTAILGQGAEIYIDENKQMGVRKLHQGQVVADIQLGVAYEKHLENILLHIGSLRIHTIRS